MKNELIEQVDLCEQELMLLHNRMILLGNELENDKDPKAGDCFKLCGLLKDVHEGLTDLRD